MTRAQHLAVAYVLSLAGLVAAASIALRAGSRAIERAVTLPAGAL